ncbi:carbohydrate ABC transporter permease [Phyllobacterium zundukense]|uniref:Sugar ABC transporter permease n=1 Tax=Phyllobacterium zundukense TaxID=1867719 RepID=A0ACD4CVM9_9HYPH|nr:sugar ABC transporter permease [Phyllobacterium zundukense]UXN57542.1 sugar ABC transporter permease [Phyllobacterium zundukense]
MTTLAVGERPSLRDSVAFDAVICISPAILLLVAMTLLPLAAVVVLSFTDYQLGGTDIHFIGIENFMRVGESDDAGRAILNTLRFTALVVPASVAIGLVLALLVSARGRLRRAYELLLFLPLTATMTVMAIVWSLLLHGQIGPINVALKAMGLAPVEFLSNVELVLPSLALIAVWQQSSFCFVVFLAGLSAIPTEVYEAAALDRVGSGWERFRRITWPLLAPTTVVVLLLTTIKAFQVFDLVAVLTQGGPQGATDVLLYETYLQAFSYFRIGYGSALIMLFIAFVGIVSTLQMWFARRRQP